MHDAHVRESYARCRAVQRRHDPTFHVATQALGRDVRPAVHALYGFVRGADEIVDGPDRPPTAQDRREALDAWQATLEDGLATGHSDHPVIAALVDAGVRHRLPLSELGVYMDSMRVDCDGRVRLRTRQELDRYMDGSAAAVGRIMAPLIGVRSERREDVARLGTAFQLTNFLRDVREDFAMDRVYLPGVDEDALAAGRRAVPAEELHRARELFGSARAVLSACTPRARPGIAFACGVYRLVLRRVEHSGVVG
ncbi:phytoene/squalene synthase family protein [Baekduia soli]|uniref:Phytoene/squalene synthase family protein n=1 Tax=Baekduia soli TaxID=496014 RepID=A0A5B8U9G0_9ACTN|nr:phytoene/squalene synthase family protein [Baekduia soli]QEC49627.1 phytoene/squalene synthase family protein [Baekduia soli]